MGKSRCVKLKPTTTMSATAAASASEIVVDFHEKNGQPPPPPVDNASEFKSSNTTNNLWLDFFGAADQKSVVNENSMLEDEYNLIKNVTQKSRNSSLISSSKKSHPQRSRNGKAEENFKSTN